MLRFTSTEEMFTTKKGEFDRTIKDFDVATRLNPQDAAGYYNRGTANVRKGKYDKGITDYEKAIKLDPEWSGFYCCAINFSIRSL